MKLIAKVLVCCWLLYGGSLGAQCVASFEALYGAGASLDTEAPTYVHRFGFGGSVRLAEKFWLRTGFQFAQYALRGAERRTVALYQEGGLTVRRAIAPRWRNDNWIPFVEAGILAGGYTGTSAGRDANGLINSVGDPERRNFALIGRLAAGYDWWILDRFSVYAGAVAQRHLRAVYVDRRRGSHPTTASLELGFRLFVTR